MFNWFKKKTYVEKADTGKKGICKLCEQLSKEMSRKLPDDLVFNLKEDTEDMFNLLGIDVCEGCFHELINLMSYKDYNKMIEFDKKQLQLFLNMVVKKIVDK